MPQRVISVVLLVAIFFGLITLAYGMSSWRLPDREQGYAPEQPLDYSHRLHAGELQMDCLFCHTAAQQSRHAGIPASDVCMKCHQFVTSSFEVMQQQQRLADEAESRGGEENSNSSTGPADAAEIATDEAEIAADEAEIAADEAEIAAEEAEIAAEEAETTADEPEIRLAELEIPSREIKKLYRFLGLDNQLQPIGGERPQSIPWVRVHNLPDFVYFNHQAHVAAGVTCQRCHGPVESMQRMRQFESLSMGWCVNCHRDATKNGIEGQAVNASTNCSVCHY